MFFLGEIFVDMALPVSEPVSAHCGSCQACRTVCPTGAIVADGLVDARRCISYLTIEHEGDIPEQWREAMGNRIYGCDDCQLACPWNKYAQLSTLADFDVRSPWQAPQALQYWAWSEDEFLRHTEGTPIRRIGHARWLRNLAVALGNALRGETDAAQRDRLGAALQERAHHPDDRVRRHVQWALAQAEVSATPAPECGRG